MHGGQFDPLFCSAEAEWEGGNRLPAQPPPLLQLLTSADDSTEKKRAKTREGQLRRTRRLDWEDINTSNL